MGAPDQKLDHDPSNPQRQQQHDHDHQTRSAPSAPPPPPPPAVQETSTPFPPAAGSYINNIPPPPHEPHEQPIPNFPPVQPPPENYNIPPHPPPHEQPIPNFPPQPPPIYQAQVAPQNYAPPRSGQYPAYSPPIPVLPPANTVGWKTGLFDCFDDPVSALMAFFFPCVPFGQIAEIVDNGHTSCSTSGLMYVLVTVCIGLPCILTCSYRAKLRNKFSLVESPAPDWVVHCLCECCAISQAYRELQLRGWDPSIGWEGNVARQNQQIRMVSPARQAMRA